MGFTVEQLPNGGIVKYSGTNVRVCIDKDNVAALLGWSFPWSKRRKLGYAVERILLASGMQAFFKPHSTNLIYQVAELPNYAWLEKLKPTNTDVIYARNIGNNLAKKDYPCGSFRAGVESIHFWTGPAIDLETKAPIYFIALDADVGRLEFRPPDSFLNSLDSSLTGKGAKRVEAQCKLDR
jgi:hypothetical protein